MTIQVPIERLARGSDEACQRALPEERSGRAAALEDRAEDKATLHGLFEAQARKTPGRVAAVCGDLQLSYRELDSRARQVAARLTLAGVKRGSLVGLYAERSLDMAVGLLAIVKAGGAYVPLDPDYPVERLSFILADTGVSAILTQRHLVHRLPACHAQVLCCDDLGTLGSDVDDEAASIEGKECDLAYVMYTSGSTGRPKGVMIEHGAVVNTINDINQRFAIDADDSVLALSSCAFDLSVYDTFGMWAAGGTVVIPEASGARDPAYWAQLLLRHRVTIWNSVPSSMEMLLAQQDGRGGGSLASLRLVLLSGDWIPVTLPDGVRALNPGAHIVSLGGATEASIWSILYPIDKCDPNWRSIPYGRAMLNQSMHVLDEQLRPCPPDEVGQIYIGGVGLARGYHNRPELTAERFLENVSLGRSTARLYATGDLGRLQADGNIEFLGRTDGQVKIRGYRIELGEVESALCKHPAIRHAVVLAKERSGHKQLIAYCVAISSTAPPAGDLRAFLRRLLPEYMLPAQFVALERMPLSANGKIDRQALSALDVELDHAKGRRTSPANDVERRLHEIWKESFALDTIGTDDDFFALGGNSLLAAGMFARIERTFGQALPFNALLQCPTIRLLAAQLENLSTRRDACCVQIQAGTSRPPVFCLPGIGGNLLGFRALAGRLGPSQPVFGLPPIGFDDGQVPHRTIAAMAAHAVRSVRGVQPEGPYHLVGFSLGGVVAFEMAQQLRAAGQTTALLALLDSELWSPSVGLSVLQKTRLHLRQVRGNGGWSYLRERGRILAHRILRADLRQAEDDLVAGLDLSPAQRDVARVHWQAWRDYIPRAYDGELTLFVAQRDRALALTVNGRDPLLGWSRWTTRPIQAHSTGVLHAEILRAEELHVLTHQLQVDRSALAVTGICT